MSPLIDDSKPGEQNQDDEPLLHVLVRANLNWSPPDGFEINYQVGQFIKGLASKAAYEALAEDRDVISYETDLTIGRLT